MPDSSESKGSSINSLDMVTSPNESYLDALLFYDDSKSDCAISFAPSPFVASRDSPFLFMASAMVEVSSLNKERLAPSSEPTGPPLVEVMLRLGSISSLEFGMLVSIGSSHQISFGMMKYLEEVSILWSRPM